MPILYRNVAPSDPTWTPGNGSIVFREGKPSHRAQMKITHVEWSGTIDPSCLQLPDPIEGEDPWQWRYEPVAALAPSLINDVLRRRTQTSTDYTPPYETFYYNNLYVEPTVPRRVKVQTISKYEEWHDGDGNLTHSISIWFDTSLVWDETLSNWEWGVFGFGLAVSVGYYYNAHIGGTIGGSTQAYFRDRKGYSAGTSDTKLRIGSGLRMEYCGSHPELNGTAITIRAAYA